jgi:hypothetical protein
VPIGQAVTEVRIVLPRAGLVHERERDRPCSHCPGLRWHPARVISSHPRSITPAEPTRLGTPRRDWPAPVPVIADVTQMATALVPECPQTGLGQATPLVNGIPHVPHNQPLRHIVIAGHRIPLVLLPCSDELQHGQPRSRTR